MLKPMAEASVDLNRIMLMRMMVNPRAHHRLAVTVAAAGPPRWNHTSPPPPPPADRHRRRVRRRQPDSPAALTNATPTLSPKPARGGAGPWNFESQRSGSQDLELRAVGSV